MANREREKRAKTPSSILRITRSAVLSRHAPNHQALAFPPLPSSDHYSRVVIDTETRLHRRRRAGSSECLRDRKTHNLCMRNAERACQLRRRRATIRANHLPVPVTEQFVYITGSTRASPAIVSHSAALAVCQTHERSFCFPASRRSPHCVSYITSVTPPLDPRKSI